jgi:hypothetical protein
MLPDLSQPWNKGDPGYTKTTCDCKHSYIWVSGIRNTPLLFSSLENFRASVPLRANGYEMEVLA